MKRKTAIPAHRAIDALYAAAVDGGQWLSALKTLNEYVGVQSSFLVSLGLSPAQRSLSVIANLDRGVIEGQYLPHYIELDPGPKYLDSKPAGTVVGITELVPEREWVNMEVFADCISKVPDCHYTAGLVVSRNGHRAAVMGLQRAKGAGDFTRADLDRIRSLTPHLARALQIAQRMGSAESLASSLGALFADVAGAVWLLDESGRVAFMNRSAERLAQTGEFVQVNRGWIVAHTPEETARLRARVHEAVQTGLGLGSSAGGAAVLHSADGSRRITVLVAPLCTGAGKAGFGTRVCAAIFLPQAKSPFADPAEVLRQTFGLTATEARVAVELGAGRTPQDIADRLGITWETVRSHRRAIYQKAGVRSQAELVRLLLTHGAGTHENGDVPTRVASD